MMIDVIGSIIITLILMFICYIFNIGFFGAILLMMVIFSLMNYRSKLTMIWYRFTSRFEKKVKKPEVKSSYDFMDMDE